MMNEIPGLAASTPHDPEDNVFGFETPSPKSSYKKKVSSNPQGDDVLPHHYGGQEFFTPAEKLGTALRRFRSRFSSPFHTPRGRLEDRFNGYSARHKNFLPCLVVTMLLLGCTVLYSHHRNTLAADSSFSFRPQPVSNTPSDKAVKVFRNAYKTMDEGWMGLDDPLNPGAVFCLLDPNSEASDDQILVNDEDTRDFALGFETYLNDHLTTLIHRMGQDTVKQPLVEVTSYYSLSDFPHLAEAHYATPDGRTILVEIRFAVPPSAKPQDYASSVVDTVQRYGELHSPDYVDVTYTGLPLFQSEMIPSRGMGALNTMLPASAPSMSAYKRLAENFGPGMVTSYRIVFDGRDNERHINTKEAFETMHNVMEAFVEVDATVAPIEEEIEEDLEMMMGIAAVNLDSIPQRTEDGHLMEHLGEVMDELYGEIGMIEKDKILPVYGSHGQDVFKSHRRTTYDGVAYLRNNPVPYPLFLAASLCLNKNKPHCPVELLHLFSEMSDELTTSDGMTTYVEVMLGFDPFSEDGIKWLEAARQKLQDLESEGVLDGFNVFIDGGASLEYDVARSRTSHSGYFVVPQAVLALLGLLAVKYAIVPLASRIKGRAGAEHYHKNV